MSFAPWRSSFEASALRPLPAVSDHGIPEAWRAPLASSLARFALGESGEGRIAREIWKVTLPGVDDDYRTALGLFVAEEGRHGRILLTAVRALGGEPLRHNWTEMLFRRGRRLLGTRLKLLVLLVAEVVSLACYGALIQALPNSPIRDALRQIREDETRHLAFHADLFRRWTQHPFAAAVFATLFATIATAAAVTVILDHRATWRLISRSPASMARDFRSCTADALFAVLGTVPVPVPVR